MNRFTLTVEGGEGNELTVSAEFDPPLQKSEAYQSTAVSRMANRVMNALTAGIDPGSVNVQEVNHGRS